MTVAVYLLMPDDTYKFRAVDDTQTSEWLIFIMDEVGGVYLILLISSAAAIEYAIGHSYIDIPRYLSVTVIYSYH